MIKKRKTLSIILASVVLLSGLTSTSFAKENKRISGKDRIETSVKIAENMVEHEGAKEVILTSSENFPDSLGGAVLSGRNGVPILLVGKQKNNSKRTFDFIVENLNKNGKVTVLGSEGAVSADIVKELNRLGYHNIHRIEGKDRYETNLNIVKSVDTKVGTPIILATGENFPDALSMSSVSAIKGYPILLTRKHKIEKSSLDYIVLKSPKVMYVAGSEGAVSSVVVNEIKKASPKTKIIRLGGSDRYETSSIIAKEFKDDMSDTVYVATGQNFPDALSGSAIAGKDNAPILLMKNSIKPHLDYLTSKELQNAFILGGESVVSPVVEDELAEMLEIYEEDQYEKYFDFEVVSTTVDGKVVTAHIETSESDMDKIKSFSKVIADMIKAMNDFPIDKIIINANGVTETYTY